jgi:hypothetical protein
MPWLRFSKVTFLYRERFSIHIPFLKAMVKMFHARRNPDPAQKKQIAASSKIVADIMLKHLSLSGFGM